ncbi:hypothetical protein OIU76_008329 [Salix suchowensis]|uniref:PROTEIN TIC 22-LIKE CHLOROPLASTIC n=1 Tax=Salix koriyanagi TaxID=2511006 RepID=A0A9Q0TFW2_9ROSI|nr:hypothetical protein OIU76_008329 [Salix suchowensis]KAJ6338844.1 hypothetical protein OIU76_008329 [Salix suchowensis]KAJ6710852.1 PROTEIN TIC 22-LIKE CHLOROPLASTIC [Salix koriyanagi]KAJ6710853.1 PROTEIN TIC 22-LIKE CHLOROPLASTIC [Salix koriyanagi]
MNFLPKSNDQQIFPASKQAPQIDLHHAFTTLQDHCSTFLQNLSHQFPLFNPNFQTHTRQSLDTLISRLNPNYSFSSKNPSWARISHEPISHPGTSMSTETIEERLAGVPVYALSNSNEEFVLVSGLSTGKSLGLFCFKQEDAEALLEQMKSMDPGMRKGGSKVVPVALNKVFQLKIDGVAFRLIPEPSQVKNALLEREQAGLSDDAFSGVPVFQSRSLVLKSQNKSYRPVFFRKEDLEKSLSRASHEQHKLNPAFKQGDIEVAVFEEIIKSMKEGSTTTWDDVVFIPPGFDVSTTPPKQ